MNYGRLAVAAIGATVVYYAYGFVVEGLLIRKDFSPYSAVYRSADTVMGYMPLGLACTLIVTLLITTLFANSHGGVAGLRRGHAIWPAGRNPRGVYVRRSQLWSTVSEL